MKKHIFIAIFAILSMSIKAQITLHFYYDCKNSIVPITHSTIYLKSKNKTEQLLCDTIRQMEFHKNNFLKNGNYSLFFKFENSIFATDSINYFFSVDGKETNITINVNLSYDYWYKTKKNIGNGRVKITKYYDASSEIEIKYLPDQKGSEYYKPPFFMLKNNSQDTIYGYHIPNYFWGTISFCTDKNADWSKEFFGSLDYEFGGGSPLYPHSSGLAWVGSFGWRKELPKLHYKYTLFYSAGKFESEGIRLFLEKENFIWWADTKKYYKLVYEFDVE